MAEDKNHITIGIGEMAISKAPVTTIKTFALGSCVSLTLFNPVRKIGAMLHMALPDSKIDKKKASTLPGYFVDTAITALNNKLKELKINPSECVIKIAGGANSLQNREFSFDIGKRNVLATKKYLWKYGLQVISEDVGGSISRTVHFNIKTGDVLLSNAQGKWSL